MAEAPTQIKRTISTSFTIPGNSKVKRETRVVKQGDEVTAAMRKDWEAWQKEANSGGNININDYTS